MKSLAALVRLRDEETWCRLALESILWCDEIVIVTNCCTDRTPEIVAEFQREHPDKVRVFDYPHEIWPMGPGHDKIGSDDPRSSAALYNFTLSKCTSSHAMKWDGDMIAQDWLGREIRKALEGHDRITFHGVDLVDDLKHLGCDPVCWKSPNNGVFRVTKDIRWEQGPMTQHMRGAPPPTKIIDGPAFVHLKWCSPLDAVTVQWPDNWKKIPHFQKIMERRKPIASYGGDYPASIRALL